jgi:pSer/pThr/pTyr-binding forkhead associated (FHA) protein
MDVGLVCDKCSALTAFGIPQCSRCGESIALDPRSKRQSEPPLSSGVVARDDQPCPKCNAIVGAAHKFCFSCGTRMPDPFAFEETQIRKMHGTPGRSTMFFGVAQAARARLTLIRGDGEDGVSFTLAGEEHVAGRSDCAISFPEDSFMSPTHANFLYRDGKLVVRDEGSTNGVYVRITTDVEIGPNSKFLVGEQVLSARPSRIIADTPEPDGTYFSASLPRAATFEIVQHLRGGEIGRVVRVDATHASLGRENSAMNFPEDPFISGRHAEIRKQGGFFLLVDVGSRNGTFVRIDGEQVLSHGDFVFLGQQLLRIEIV